MSAIQIYRYIDAEAHERERHLFLIGEEISDWVRYGLVIRGYGTTHYCAYLNLPKADWLKVADEIRSDFDVSFEGIESTNINIPNEFMKSVPVDIHDYWIGVDYMDKIPQPDLPTLAHELDCLLYAIAVRCS